MVALAACLLAPLTMSAQATFYVDFGANNTQNGSKTTGADQNGHYWNNVAAQGTADAAPAYPQAVQLVTAENTPTAYELVLSSRFTTNGRLNGALLEPDATKLGDLAVATATEDYIFTEPAQDYVNILFRNLNCEKGYVFTVFGYRQSAGQRQATFRFDGENTFSEVYNTTSANGMSTLTSDPVFPNRNGVITLTVIKNAVNENGMVHINAMKIQEVGGTRPNQELTLRQTMLIDFGENNNDARGHQTLGADQNGRYWNNIYSTDGNWIRTGQEVQLVNVENTVTGIKATVLNDLETNGMNNGGVLAPEAADLFDLAVPTATQDYAFTSQDGEKLIKFSGLDANRLYRFYIFGSRITSSADHRRCIYRLTGREGWMMENTTSGLSVGGETVHGNVRNIQQSDYMQPTADGEIVFSLQKNVSSFAHFNIIKIEEYDGKTDAPDPADLSMLTALTITGTALADGEEASLQELRPAGIATGTFETYVRLQPGTWTLQGTNDEGQTVIIGADAEAGAITADGEAFTVETEQVVRIRVQTKRKTISITPVELYVKGNIAPAATKLAYAGNGRFAAEVTLNDNAVFLFSDKYIYFALNDDDQLSIARLTSDRTKVGMPAEGFGTENIRINGGTYTFTVDLRNYTWQVEAPIDDNKISAFGSSVCNGQGADGFKGYAYLYGEQLQARYADGLSAHPFYTSGISIGGNNTQNLLDRYDEQQRNFSRYVIIGLSLGNEGIHESTDKQQTMNQFTTNLQTVIAKIKAEGKVPVVMNNYTRGDFTLDDYAAVKQTNLLIHQWDVASVNTLGAIDDGTGKWATGYQQDNAHPTTAGHREFLYAITPSLFDALASGKAQPVRDQSGSMTLDGGRNLQFSGEGTVHPFTLSLRFRGNGAGQLLKFAQTGSAAFATVTVDADGKLTYTNISGRTLTTVQTVDADSWHTLTLTHYYAQGRTLLYLDGTAAAGELKERIELGRVMVGDAKTTASRELSELLFWRSAFSPEEVQATVGGALLKSSLELYVPTSSSTALNNLAMSLNTVQLTTDDLAAEQPGTTIGSPYEGVPVQAGEFYIYNVASGLWLQNNDSRTNKWSTFTNIGTRGIDFTIEESGSGYKLKGKFGNNTTSFNPAELWLDNGANCEWVIEPSDLIAGVSNGYTMGGESTYTRDGQTAGMHYLRSAFWAFPNQANHLFYSYTNDNRWTLEDAYWTVLHDKQARSVWQFVSREERLSVMQATASAENPQDASWLIPAADFASNDQRYSQWERTDFNRGLDADNDNRRGNMVMDCVSASADGKMVITLTNIPNGLYRFNLQGYYRDGGLSDVVGRHNNKQEVIRAYYFANDVQHQLMSILDEPLTAQNIEGQFCNESNGYYMPNLGPEASEAINRSKAFVNPEIEVVVTDGTLRLGVQKTSPCHLNSSDWTVFDNFHLTYLGQAAADAKLAAVPAADKQTCYIDFGARSSRNGSQTIGADQNGHVWNNVVPADGQVNGAKIAAGSTFALVNAAGEPMGYQVEVTTEFETNGIYNGGQMAAPASLGDMAVTSATHDYIFVNGSVSSSTITFRGLNPNHGYRFTTYGSREDTGQRTGRFTFAGLNMFSSNYNTASSNGNSTLVSDVVFPQVDGTITLTIDNHTGFVHVNAMKIEETGYLLSESFSNQLEAAENVNVTLARQLSADYWNTFCVPFSMTAGQVEAAFGAGTKITKFSGVDGNVMNFVETTAIEAGQPYLVKPATTTAQTFTVSGVTMTDTDAQSAGSGEYHFVGTYSPLDLATDGSQLFLMTNGNLASPAESTKTLKGLRAYFEAPVGAMARISFDGQTTTIGTVDILTQNATAFYSLSGQRLPAVKGQKGIVILRSADGRLQGKKSIIH